MNSGETPKRTKLFISKATPGDAQFALWIAPRLEAGSTKNLGVNRRHRRARAASSHAGARLIQSVDHEVFFSTTRFDPQVFGAFHIDRGWALAYIANKEMCLMVTRNVVLTDTQDQLIQTLVASGRYQNASETMRAGLRLLEQEEAQLADLRKGLMEGLEQANRGDLAEGSGEDAVRRAFAKARATS